MMETLNSKLLEVTAAVGKLKTEKELDKYISTLPNALKTNGLLIGLFRKRRLAIK